MNVLNIHNQLLISENLVKLLNEQTDCYIDSKKPSTYLKKSGLLILIFNNKKSNIVFAEF